MYRINIGIGHVQLFFSASFDSWQFLNHCGLCVRCVRRAPLDPALVGLAKGFLLRRRHVQCDHLQNILHLKFETTNQMYRPRISVYQLTLLCSHSTIRARLLPQCLEPYHHRISFTGPRLDFGALSSRVPHGTCCWLSAAYLSDPQRWALGGLELAGIESPKSCARHRNNLINREEWRTMIKRNER